jgi:hypothetical protein
MHGVEKQPWKQKIPNKVPEFGFEMNDTGKQSWKQKVLIDIIEFGVEMNDT